MVGFKCLSIAYGIMDVKKNCLDNWRVSMERRRIESGELISVPKLDFSDVMVPLSDEQYARVEHDIKVNSSKAAVLKRIAYFKAHPEMLLSWDMPCMLEEYERRILDGD